VLDFTSSLYLGLRHPSSSLRPWSQLTSGVPAALAVPQRSRDVAAALARLQGCERATLATSTLHLFFDLFVVLADSRTTIHFDREAYPIARWGVERAAARGVPARPFPHRDADALIRAVRADAARGWRPLVVTDGYCPGCGPAPLRAYHEIARRFGGRLVVDDTQAFGVLGAAGGGSVRRLGLAGPELVVGASLAKGFGAPIAVLAGDAAVVSQFEARAETRVHSSPPSAAAVDAAERALAVNASSGDALRARLAALVRRFRVGAAATGFAPRGGLFPVQTLTHGADAAALHHALGRLGVRTVLHDGDGRTPRISFILTARHDERDVDTALAALARARPTARAEAR
jgi:8-amino-7-oxononanoate synthase